MRCDWLERDVYYMYRWRFRPRNFLRNYEWNFFAFINLETIGILWMDNCRHRHIVRFIFDCWNNKFSEKRNIPSPFENDSFEGY